jgi:hypothetical protein
MYRVVFLPYIEGKDPATGKDWPSCPTCRVSHGSCEDIYTDRAEAENRYAALSAAVTDVETDTLEMFEIVYPKTGGWANVLLREKGQ